MKALALYGTDTRSNDSEAEIPCNHPFHSVPQFNNDQLYQCQSCWLRWIEEVYSVCGRIRRLATKNGIRDYGCTLIAWIIRGKLLYLAPPGRPWLEMAGISHRLSTTYATAIFAITGSPEASKAIVLIRKLRLWRRLEHVR